MINVIAIILALPLTLLFLVFFGRAIADFMIEFQNSHPDEQYGVIGFVLYSVIAFIGAVVLKLWSL